MAKKSLKLYIWLVATLINLLSDKLSILSVTYFGQGCIRYSIYLEKKIAIKKYPRDEIINTQKSSKKKNLQKIDSSHICVGKAFRCCQKKNDEFCTRVYTNASKTMSRKCKHCDKLEFPVLFCQCFF